jgi:hypothetical protein
VQVTPTTDPIDGIEHAAIAEVDVLRRDTAVGGNVGLDRKSGTSERAPDRDRAVESRNFAVDDPGLRA